MGILPMSDGLTQYPRARCPCHGGHPNATVNPQMRPIFIPARDRYYGGLQNWVTRVECVAPPATGRFDKLKVPSLSRDSGP
jgi:hypothetical protein